MENNITEHIDNNTNELEEYWKNKYYYLAADFENYKKRTIRENNEKEKYKNKNIITKLLELVDNFERSFKFDDSFFHLYNQLMNTLKEEGVEIINVNVGDKFDENIMNAIYANNDETIEKGHVINVFRNGYKYKDSIIRFVDVVVSKGNE